nr:hypothetical protein CFP56_00281 [Quercus suber]
MALRAIPLSQPCLPLSLYSHQSVLTMEDVIACLYPHGEADGYATRAVDNPNNHARLLAARDQLADLPGRGSCESTASQNDNADEDNFWLGRGLQLTFTHGPKAGPGFVHGTDPKRCDIVLPNLPSISGRHCYMTFDDRRHLIVRDISRCGTKVRYNGQGGESRHHFTWIIGGHRVPDSIAEIIIEIHTALKFRIVVSKPPFPDLYRQRVDDFRQRVDDFRWVPSLDALGIQSIASTAAAT